MGLKREINQSMIFTVNDYAVTNGMCRCGTQGPHVIESLGIDSFYDGKCKERCDHSSNCTGYSLEEDGWCETYASIWICGDGNEGTKCFKKKIGINCYNVLARLQNTTMILLK